MTEAAPSMTRRGFFGHAAGAYTLVSIAGAAALPTMLHMLIARHRTADAAMVAADEMVQIDPTPENRARSTERADEWTAAENDLLRWRPETIEEVRERFAYLAGADGPWCGCAPQEEQIMLLVRSMLPANA